eukprot:7828659-Lingulodinium_polyedra.AAC.1
MATRATKAAIQSIDKCYSKVLNRKGQEQLSEIVEWLSERPDKVEKVLISLKSGFFEQIMAKRKDRIPPTATKFKDVSAKFMMTVLP